MKHKFKLIEISDYNDTNLGETTLLVKLSPIELIEENNWFEEHLLFPGKVYLFFFLLDEHHKDYFLTNPEDIKYIKLDEFITGNLNKNDGTIETYYRHSDYTQYFTDYEYIIEQEMNGTAHGLQEKLKMFQNWNNEQLQSGIKELTKQIAEDELKIENSSGNEELLETMNRTREIFIRVLNRVYKNKNYC
jgi:hypothetical protein